MARLPVHRLKTNARKLHLGEASVYHLPAWNTLSHPERLRVIRQIAMMRGRDPRIAQLAVSIVRKVPPRQYKRQAAAILRWVQNPKNVYYINEPGERLQDPIHTLKVGFGDCDDLVILLGSLFEAINLPWRLVLSGLHTSGKKLRHIEGQPIPSGVRWAHIYLMVGNRPGRPGKWYFAEPTVAGAPLGWDVISGNSRYLPEMAKPPKGPATIARLGPPPKGFRPAPLPPVGRRSPAYAMAYAGSGYGQPSAAVAGSVAASTEGFSWQRVLLAVATGVAVSVGTQLSLDWLRGKGLWEGRGPALGWFASAGE